MAGFLEAGQTWLATQRTTSLTTTQTVTYERDGVESAALDGVVVGQATELIDTDSTIYVDVQRLDFIVPVAELTAVGIAEPEGGDLIHITDSGGTKRTYEVRTIGGVPAWEPHDPPLWTAYRIHTLIAVVA